jgi:hypothetical protein
MSPQGSASRSRWKSAGFLVPLGIALITGLFIYLTVRGVSNGDASQQDRHWCAALIAIEILALATLLLSTIGSPVEDLVLGKDKRLSTSKLQALLWTYLLAGLLLAIVVDNWIGSGAGYDALIDNSIPQEYLILIGGPFAAAVASRGIVGTKVQNGTLTKTEGDEDAGARTRLSEAVSDDQGNTNLVDTQYFLFNVVALVFVLGGFITDPSAGLPSIPGILVGLTSVSAATYVSNKAVQDSTPVLTAVIPAKAARGDAVRILGKNLLVPAGEDSFHEVFVMFGSEIAEVVGAAIDNATLVPDDGDAQRLPDHELSGDDEFWVEVPDSAELGALRVTARNFKGIAASEKLEFEVTATS